MDILLEHVSKRFGEKQVLRDVSLRFPGGKITCLMGPSGCGKTTLLRLLAGLVRPDSGKISGVPEKVSMVFQEERLCEDFSVLTNVLLVAPERRENAKALLEMLGLGGELDAPVRTLSGGMKRRVAIARALNYSSGLLLLDEAFKGLDENARRVAMDVVRQEAQGRTVLSVTHDPEEAASFGDLVLRLGDDIP